MNVDALIVRLAAPRDGVVHRKLLLAHGVTRHEIEQRTRDGRLQILYSGVYAVGHRALTLKGLRLAAVLAGGRDADLSHRAACEAWAILRITGSRFELTAPDRRRRPGGPLTIYRNTLHPADRTLLDGIPITTPERSLLDLAATRGRRLTETALEELCRLDLYDGRAFDALLDRHRGRRGAGTLRAALDALHPAAGDTHPGLEIETLKLLDRHSLPRPAVNVVVAGKEVDLFWPHARLAVELDSRTHHLTPAAFEADRRSDARLVAAGYRVLRFTWRQVTGDPSFVAQALRAALRDPPPRATPTPAPAAAAA